MNPKSHDRLCKSNHPPCEYFLYSSAAASLILSLEQGFLPKNTQLCCSKHDVRGSESYLLQHFTIASTQGETFPLGLRPLGAGLDDDVPGRVVVDVTGKNGFCFHWKMSSHFDGDKTHACKLRYDK